MRSFFVLGSLLCGLASVQAAGPAPAVPAPHPLIGNWTWRLTGNACTESLHYDAQGTRQATSGEEVTQSRYEITPVPSLLGFYRLTETVTQTNGKADCAGDMHKANGEPVTRFIQFSPKNDQLIMCREESLKACFGPLKRNP